MAVRIQKRRLFSTKMTNITGSLDFMNKICIINLRIASLSQGAFGVLRPAAVENGLLLFAVAVRSAKGLWGGEDTGP